MVRALGGWLVSDAVFKMSLASRSCFTSARSRRNSAASALVAPGRCPASTCALRTQFSTVCGVPMPSLSASDCAAAQSEVYSPRTSATMRIARSRNSGG